MLKRTFAIAVVLVSLAFLIESQQGSRSRKSKRSSTTDQRAKRNPPPVIMFAKDTGGRELIVRVLDVGEGDAIYIRNGSSRGLIDGGAQLHILAPKPEGGGPNNRSAAVNLIGPDSASFTMWLAGDAEREEISWFEQAGYASNPGMRVNVLKADHHGSCNGVTQHYLSLIQPEWVVVSVGAGNEYGHMHAQAKDIYRAAGIPWYRTDQNGTITIRSPGTENGGYTIVSVRSGTDLTGPSDRVSHQLDCTEDLNKGQPAPPD